MSNIISITMVTFELQGDVATSVTLQFQEESKVAFCGL